LRRPALHYSVVQTSIIQGAGGGGGGGAYTTLPFKEDAEKPVV
jgi:hypothetical protein